MKDKVKESTTREVSLYSGRVADTGISYHVQDQLLIHSLFRMTRMRISGKTFSLGSETSVYCQSIIRACSKSKTYMQKRW